MKAKQNMIMAIVMEPGLWNQDLWKGPVGIALGSQLFVDFSDPNIWKCDKEKEFSGKVQDLFEKISIKKESLSNGRRSKFISHDSVGSDDDAERRLMDIMQMGVDSKDLGDPECYDRDFLICPITKGLMERPYTLPCSHSFDFHGLEGMQEFKAWEAMLVATTDVPCPTCSVIVTEGSALVENKPLKNSVDDGL